jgi:uncharacterized protein (DUF1697 family)
MPAIVSLLRGVNVGGHHPIKMEALRALYASLNLEGAQTYVQSGNVVFRSGERDLVRLAARISGAIEQTFGFRPEVILRTGAELQSVVARNPFSARAGLEPAKLLVTFLAAEPTEAGREKLGRLHPNPEELHLLGRELFVYFPNGMGRSKLSMAAVEKLLGVAGTGRNWTSVTRLLAMAEKLT